MCVERTQKPAEHLQSTPQSPTSQSKNQALFGAIKQAAQRATWQHQQDLLNEYVPGTVKRIVRLLPGLGVVEEPVVLDGMCQAKVMRPNERVTCAAAKQMDEPGLHQGCKHWSSNCSCRYMCTLSTPQQKLPHALALHTHTCTHPHIRTHTHTPTHKVLVDEA